MTRNSVRAAWLRESLSELCTTARSVPALVRRLSGPERLYSLGCTLVLKRPRGWQARSRRAFLFVVRSLTPGLTLESLPEQDLPKLAHDALRAAQRPARRLGVAVLGLGGGSAVVLGALLLLAYALSPAVRTIVTPPDLARHATWTVSSTVPGVQQSGKGTLGATPFFFHSSQEVNPHIDLDFGREITLRRIEIDNRSDCCGLLALPLNVEVPQGAHHRLLCQRRAPFSSWTCRTEPVRTRLLRLSHPGLGTLHLSRIGAFE